MKTKAYVNLLILSAIIAACGGLDKSQGNFDENGQLQSESSDDSLTTPGASENEWAACKQQCKQVPKVVTDFFGAWECKVGGVQTLGETETEAMQRMCCHEFVSSRFSKEEVSCRKKPGLGELK